MTSPLVSPVDARGHLLSVVIPVYNERNTIREIVAAVLAAPLPAGVELEVVIVDDGSTDGTREVLATLADERTRVLLGDRNRGKGFAVRAAFAEVRGDLVVIQDADLEYDPTDYARLLAPILAGRADVVFGSRFTGGDSHRVLYFWHSVGNRLLTLFSNSCTNINLTDMESGYKLFRTEVLRRVVLRENRFGFEPEVTAKVARLKVRIYEVGISYSGRTYDDGKKVTWKDGVRALWCIFKYGLLRRN